MGQDTGQLDMSDRQLMNSNSQIKASEWTEIGQAQVVHTVFGKAKVRIVRKHDNMRRVLYLLAIGVISAIAWEGWVLYEHFETEQRELFYPRFSTKIETIPFASKAEGISSSTTTLPAKNNTKTLSQTEISDPVAIDKNKPALSHDLGNPGQINSKPMMHHPLRTAVPESASVAANGNQLDNTLLPQPVTKQPLTKPQRVVPLGVSGPSAVSPPLIPLGNEAIPRQTTGDTQFIDPINSKQ